MVTVCFRYICPMVKPDFFNKKCHLVVLLKCRSSGPFYFVDGTVASDLISIQVIDHNSPDHLFSGRTDTFCINLKFF